MDTQDKPTQKQWRLPYSEKIMRVIERFSLTEKVIFFFFVGVLCISALTLLFQVNRQFLVEVPAYGGSLTEGIIGSPRFINPILAVSESDRDITSLIYSGLLRADENGTLQPDLAQSYTVSPDGLTYSFVLKNNATFQDGTRVTADDIVYTIEKAKDDALKSPRKSSWDGVTVTKIDDRTVQFVLSRPYSPFIQNATLGILPKHIWSKATDEEFPFSQFNSKPIGSGPYEISSITYASSGLPSEYHLTSFKNYVLGKPYITTVILKSYEDETALVAAFKNKNIESIHGISPKSLADISTHDDTVLLSPLPRVFGVFFNQNTAPVFVNKEVRQALDVATDKDQIIQTVLGGFGQTIDQAIPPSTLSEDKTSATSLTASSTDRIQAAKNILTKAGWKQNASGIFEKKDKKSTITLAFSISTGDAPELKATAELLQQQWQKIGAQVSVKIFEVSDLNQNIIRPRKYDALLFGEIIGRDRDLYPFWHSSERNDPGLNIALYTNLKVDKILENLRGTTDLATQNALYTSFNNEISADDPAVFIYSPYFIYIVPDKIHNVGIGSLNSASERFSNIYQWYIETDNVWKILKGV